MKKILMVGVILLAICISVSAVSADEGWSFNFGQSESTNSNGGAFSLNTQNNLLQVQQLNYTIPDGYKENETYRVVGEQYNETNMPDGTKITAVQFVKGNDTIIVKVYFGDEEFKSYTPEDNAVEKKIAGVDGWLEEFNNGVSFDYVKDGKMIELFAPDEKVLESILESSNK